MLDPSPQLAAYLDRIGWTAPVAPDLATLAKLPRAHVEAIPFENLDIQLGRPPTRDPDAIFAKLVTARRGGVVLRDERTVRTDASRDRVHCDPDRGRGDAPAERRGYNGQSPLPAGSP